MIADTNAKPSDVRLGSVLAILTTRFTSSALILVTAATEDDDTRLLATSIAQLVHSSGKRAAYVPLVPPLSAEGGRPGLYTVLRPSEGTLASPAAFNHAAAAWREKYDLLFVDAPDLLTPTVVMHLARTADGVLIAMRRGRAASARDREAAAILSHLGARTLGVVTTPARPRPANGTTATAASRSLAESDFRTQTVES